MPESKEKVLLAIASAPKNIDENFFKQLVEDKIIACINIIEKIKSIYIFQGKYCEDDECLVIMKLKESNKEKLKTYFENNHPYNVPELLFFSVEDGIKSYLDFVLRNS